MLLRSWTQTVCLYTFICILTQKKSWLGFKEEKVSYSVGIVDCNGLGICPSSWWAGNPWPFSKPFRFLSLSSVFLGGCLGEGRGHRLEAWIAIWTGDLGGEGRGEPFVGCINDKLDAERTPEAVDSEELSAPLRKIPDRSASSGCRKPRITGDLTSLGVVPNDRLL